MSDQDISCHIKILGGGLAGCEAALTAARLGLSVELMEMKPGVFTPAHRSPLLGELVCSNSLRSADPTSAVGLLKLEMSLAGSAVMEAARATQVGAGKALAVDREKFAAHLDGRVRSHPGINLRQERAETLPSSGWTVLATGPLTDGPLADDLARISGSEHLHFYDAIAPIVAAESVDPERSFWADRYDAGPGDYLNCPMDQTQYQAFFQALTSAEQTPLHDFENPRFFEGCLPIEVMASRGEKTLLFGPMKPVGLNDPATGLRHFAVVQLRKEDASGRLLNMVGFQTKLTRSAQDRVFRLIPALEKAEFVRWGSIHRNTFLDAPRVLSPHLSLKNASHILVAGQVSGVEGYVESAAMGILAGINLSRLVRGLEVIPPPPTTAFGALLSHLANTETKSFQPSNVNFGLFPPLEGKVPKKERGRRHARRALNDFTAWLRSLDLEIMASLPEL